MICLDSTLVIDFLKNKPEAIEACDKVKNEQLATTTVNIFEILFGVLRKKQASYDNELEGLMKFISNLNILNLDYDSSVRASQIASDLVKKGVEIETHDCLIAGAMLSNNCNKIITRDKEHFQRIKGIKVESY